MDHYIRSSALQVFREEIAKLTQEEKELETLFSNIMDIYEVTVSLLGSLEDIMEVADEKQTPTVGSCFEELAEFAEFDVYIKYARVYTPRIVTCHIVTCHIPVADTRET